MPPQTDIEAMLKVNGSLELSGDSVEFTDAEPTIVAAAGEPAKPALKKFSMLAYSGGAMRVGYWPEPVVVDLSGMNVPNENVAILKDHDPGKVVGHATAVTAEKNLKIAGLVSGTGPDAQEVVATSANGFPWRASIGASVQRMEFVAEGQKCEANGRTFSGPCYLASKSTLGEVSFVAVPADMRTAARIAATAANNGKESHMPATETPETKAPVQTPPPVQAAAPVVKVGNDGGDEITAARERMASEYQRIADIQAAGEKHPALVAQGIKDGWTVDRFKDQVKIADLQAARPKVTAGIVHNQPDSESIGQMIEASVCQAGNLTSVEKVFDAKTLEAADKRFKGGIALQEILLEAAWANGYQGHSFRRDPHAVMQAAFSTQTLQNVFANIANKFLLSGFTSVENVWQQIAATRNVKDFKQVTSFRLSAGMIYEEVGPTGELKHGDMGSTPYTNQAKTYGKMFSITRKDWIDDDLGCLTQTPFFIGRGGALKLNIVFWTAFMNNAAFFAAGNNNYVASAATALSIDGLTAAELLLRTQTDPAGNLFPVMPKLLLVPPALSVTARRLMASLTLMEATPTTGAGDTYGTTNPHAGKFRDISSAYLSNAAITGYSAKAYYMLADPNDVPVIEVAFLNGIESPTVEQVQAESNVLGLDFRGYFDFGVNLQEFRGGVKMKGEA